ncbi:MULTISPECIES: hypothetical protein [Streptosporangium]|uniref:Uncharacterized protein n=1 Tax=Streptosporangium brasiliense TaxID=47480 RepID=A0ABT9RM62_9ACTN|nr:hypothetical protein [Streptosporangium brasiliense]MDP9870386.1 hypothetical protein [Streptosporangium brasiliense]
MNKPLTLSTPELQAGDVVLTYGMRVRLSPEPRIYQNRGTVYAWNGTVENLDEVKADGFVPMSFLSEGHWVDGKGWVYEVTGRWVIQGNDLATWAVMRSA